MNKTVIFKAFIEYANALGCDTAHTHNGLQWIFLNPSTQEFWQAVKDISIRWQLRAT